MAASLSALRTGRALLVLTQIYFPYQMSYLLLNQEQNVHFLLIREIQNGSNFEIVFHSSFGNHYMICEHSL
jgi:uncharacterized protein YueI